MIYRFFFILISFLSLLTCQNKRSTKQLKYPNSQIYTIDIEECLKNKRELMLSSLADTIEYVILKTPKDVIITSIKSVLIANDYIFIISKGIPYQFNRDGSFVRQIGNRGKGPGEYLSANNIFFTNKKVIGICSFPRLFYYSINGIFLSSVQLNHFSYAEKNDSVLWCTGPPRGVYTLAAVAFNEKMDTIAKIPNSEIFKSLDSHNSYMVVSKLVKPFYNYDNRIFYKGYEDNDTIWNVSELVPKVHAIINLGKFKLPKRDRIEYSSDRFKKNASKYSAIVSVMEDNRFFFLTLQPRLSDSISNTYILFEKLTSKGYVINNRESTGITDDILFGSNFWPIAINNNYYVGAIEGFDLINKVKKYPNMSTNFKRILNNINISSNQLLIICKKKK